MKFDDLLKALPKLSQDQLKQVAARVHHLRVPEERESEDWLWQGVVYELQRRGLIQKKFKLTGDLKAQWNREAPAIQDSLLARSRVSLNDHERITLGKIAARALADRLESWGVPIYVLTLVRNLKRTLAAFEHSFPDYLGAGMVGMLVQFNSERAGAQDHAARSTTATAARVHSDDAGVRRPARGQNRRASSA